MLDIIKVSIAHGYQAIPDDKKAVLNKQFRGLPIIKNEVCLNNCAHCADLCPASAITLKPFTIDLGKCILCGDCARLCKDKNIEFTNYHKISSTDRKFLIINKNSSKEEFEKNAIKTRDDIKKIYGRSLKLRQVSAAGCNGCEMELNACGNVNFDMGRFGIEFVASPRHADGVVITGPISENMARALDDTYRCIPDPKIIIAVGSCAISGGVFADSKALERCFLEKHKVDLYIPGCPVHPLTFINGILSFCGR